MARRKRRRMRRGFALFITVVFVVALAFGYMLYRKGYLDEYLHAGHSSSSSSSSSSPSDIVTADLSIHFPMLGNANSGDCTLIKVGDTEVLIDAGSKRNSAPAVTSYISEYCTDGVLEYVIATHAHEDHIAAFVGQDSDKTDGVFETFECKTIIEFAQTNSTSKIYGAYQALRDAEVEAGATCYTALQCWNQTDGAKRSYELSEGITLNILYQKFYEEKGDENNYSVCTLLSQGDNHYLFTGDLEEEGEESLVESNDLPKVKLFKAGHHGSKTSSTDALLSVVEPEIVCVCCCCGNMEYAKDPLSDFPSQDFTNRVARYTKRIFVTTITASNADKFAPMNGNIVLTSTGGEVSVVCSENDIYFKDTEWFKANRTWPSYGVQ